MAMFIWKGVQSKAAAENYLGSWNAGESVRPERFGRVMTFQADGDELHLIKSAMNMSAGNVQDASGTPTYNELARQLSDANSLIKGAKKEAYKMRSQSFTALSGYPVLDNLASDFGRQDITKMELRDLIVFLGKSRKIECIKEIRRRFDGMGLFEAKMMADGFWRNYGWE